MSICIALDAMGGDPDPSGQHVEPFEKVIAAACIVLTEHPEVNLILVGQEDKLRPALASLTVEQRDRIEIHHASGCISMDAEPARALRQGRESSMWAAIELVREGRAAACVSAGNTGALMVIAKYLLKTLPGIDRPAITSPLPNRLDGMTHVLDLGANVDLGPEQLVQFAIMGAALSEAEDDLNALPKVGLLNIGEEDIKGNAPVKQAHAILNQLEEKCFDYVGFVEGDDIYSGEVNVVVCDGFVGNIALKTSEGLARMIMQRLRSEFNRNAFTKLAGAIAKPVLKGLADKLNPSHYNGASLLGLQGIVIKSHGNADAMAFSYAIKEAIIEADKNIPSRINARVETLLGEKETA